MELKVAPRCSPRLISSRSSSTSRPGPGVHASGLAVRIVNPITALWALLFETSICSAISLNSKPLARRRRAIARCSGVRPGRCLTRCLLGQCEPHWLTEKLRGPLESAHIKTRPDEAHGPVHGSVLRSVRQSLATRDDWRGFPFGDDHVLAH